MTLTQKISNQLQNENEPRFVTDDLDLIKNYLTRAFIKKYTGGEDLESFLNQGGFSASSEAVFHAIPEASLDELVNQHSRYETWSEMVTAAGEDYFVTQMKAIKFK